MELIWRAYKAQELSKSGQAQPPAEVVRSTTSKICADETSAGPAGRAEVEDDWVNDFREMRSQSDLETRQ